MDLGLKDKVVVVTGSTGGIGEAIVELSSKKAPRLHARRRVKRSLTVFSHTRVEESG